MKRDHVTNSRLSSPAVQSAVLLMATGGQTTGTLNTLVIGGTGATGRHLVGTLLRAKARVWLRETRHDWPYHSFMWLYVESMRMRIRALACNSIHIHVSATQSAIARWLAPNPIPNMYIDFPVGQE